MAEVKPFPLARRRAFVLKQARRMAAISVGAAERHLQNTLRIQQEAMLRRGIDIEPQWSSAKPWMPRSELPSGGRS